MTSTCSASVVNSNYLWNERIMFEAFCHFHLSPPLFSDSFRLTSAANRAATLTLSSIKHALSSNPVMQKTIHLHLVTPWQKHTLNIFLINGAPSVMSPLLELLFGALVMQLLGRWAMARLGPIFNSDILQICGNAGAHALDRRLMPERETCVDGVSHTAEPSCNKTSSSLAVHMSCCIYRLRRLVPLLCS